jgi:WD40 repeat protein
MMFSFSKNGKIVVSASEDATLGVWDAHSLKLLKQLRYGKDKREKRMRSYNRRIEKG